MERIKCKKCGRNEAMSPSDLCSVCLKGKIQMEDSMKEIQTWRAKFK